MLQGKIAALITWGVTVWGCINQAQWCQMAKLQSVHGHTGL